MMRFSILKQPICIINDSCSSDHKKSLICFFMVKKRIPTKTHLIMIIIKDKTLIEFISDKKTVFKIKLSWIVSSHSFQLFINKVTIFDRPTVFKYNSKTFEETILGCLTLNETKKVLLFTETNVSKRRRISLFIALVLLMFLY